jgi:integrase
MDPRLLSVVSKAMRHKTTKTTEIYYGRVRTDRAFAELENLYAAPNVQFSK